MNARAVIVRADARQLPLPDTSVDLIVTSPPYYGLRSYTDGSEHYAGQVGSEATPAEYVAELVACTREWIRVLKPSGSLFVNLGDKYAGTNGTKGGTSRSTLAGAANGRPRDMTEGTFRGGGQRITGQPKCLLGLPWRYAIACIDQLGLILRAELVWSKPNGMPESVQDRVRRSHEQIFHFTKQARYYSAVDEIREPHKHASYGRATSGQCFGTIRNGMRHDAPAHLDGNPLGKLPGSVWSVPTQPLTIAPELGIDHFAAFPMELPRRIILGWTPPGICAACGEGRRPVTAGGRNGDGSKPHEAVQRIASFDWAAWKDSTPHTITGYSCFCAEPSAPTRPAVVLDPFGGTGTTALVASVLDRTGITVDRSADYCRLAAWRTTDPGERARALQVPKPPSVGDGQASLFDEV